MFDELLLLTTAVVGMALIRAARGSSVRPGGYAWVLAGILGLTLASLAGESRFLGAVAIALGQLVVVVPWAFEWGARVLFSRGYLRPAVWMAGARSVLLLGAGLGRQQEILRGLAILEGEGVPRALEHFRSLAHATEDEAELALINEQIVSMFLYGQRWNEGITHYEARFHPRHAAMRPALVLGLLRAYGEVGRLEEAATLLQALEEGPVGSDPRALGLVSQARLTFLVYAGAAQPVNDALGEGGLRLLGLSAASGALFRGLVAWRAGEPSQARNELTLVESLAGRRDDRVVESARLAMSELGDPPVVALPVEVADDLHPYVESVSRKLRAFVAAAPAVRRVGTLRATPAMLVAMGLGYAVFRMVADGGLGLLMLGAPTVEMLRDGAWWRMCSALWVHGDPISLLLDMYTLWVTAPLLERVVGSARTALTGCLGGIAGVAVAGVFGVAPGGVIGGGSAVACAVAGAAAWVVLSGTHPQLGKVGRRKMWIPFALVAVAQGVGAVPGVMAVDASWAGLLVAAAVGVLMAMLPQGAAVRAASRVGLAAVLVGCVAAAVQVGVSDDEVAMLDASRWRTVDVNGVVIETPAIFEVTDERQELPGLGLPVQVGLVDSLAMRGGELALFAVTPAAEAGADTAETPALLRVDPSLGSELTLVELPTQGAETELPASFVEAYVGAGGDEGELSLHRLRRNGVRLGFALTRRIGTGEQASAVVLVALGESLGRFGQIYGRGLATAAPALASAAE